MSTCVATYRIFHREVSVGKYFDELTFVLHIQGTVC